MIFAKKSKFHDAGGPDTVVSPSHCFIVFLVFYDSSDIVLWRFDMIFKNLLFEEKILCPDILCPDIFTENEKQA